MEKEIRDEFEKLAAMVATGFAELREELATLHREAAEVKSALEKNLHETQYLDRKLDNRFDLLERMLFDNIGQDRNRLGILETKVKELSGTRS
jgi:hypothetical protein